MCGQDQDSNYQSHNIWNPQALPELYQYHHNIVKMKAFNSILILLFALLNICLAVQPADRFPDQNQVDEDNYKAMTLAAAEKGVQATDHVVKNRQEAQLLGEAHGRHLGRFALRFKPFQ